MRKARRSILTPVPPVIIVHDQRGYDPAGHAARLLTKRHTRDREQKAKKYATDAAFREHKKAVERARYWRDPERRKSRMLVENMTPEQIERARARSRARHWQNRDRRVAYARSYSARPDVKAKRRAATAAKALLREVLALLEPGAAKAHLGGRRRLMQCPRAGLLATPEGFTAMPSARLPRAQTPGPGCRWHPGPAS